MTVCIASISRRDNQIITVTDLLLSNKAASIETNTVKHYPLVDSNRWLGLFAGEPSPAMAVFEGARRLLEGGTDDMAAVATAFEEAYRTELKRKIEGEILSPLGIDRATFLSDGRELLGDNEFVRLLYQVRNANLGVIFLVAGFGADTVPHVLTVSNPGVCTDHTQLGFSAIGVGQQAASGSLMATYDPSLNTSGMIYRVCEAKFRAEAAPGVGQRTFVIALADDGTQMRLHPDQIPELKEIWRAKGNPPVPLEATDYITAKLAPLTWSAKPPLKQPMS